MKPLFFFWLLFLSLPLSLNDGRLSPLSLPISPTSPFPQSPHSSMFSQPQQPISLSPSTMAADAPSGFQIQGVKEDRHKFRQELMLVIIVVPSVLGMITALLLCVWIARRCFPGRSGPKDVENFGNISKGNSLKMNSKKRSISVMEYAVIESATNNCDSYNILRGGGFRCVYKAQFNDNFLAEVKRLDNGTTDCQREFENEVDLMSRLKHPNLVSLLGYCIHGETRFLIYEFMLNGTLESQLHGSSHGSSLSWHIRMKIALDAARGLEYLHEHCNPPVIHRDLKPANILLDSNFNAKISNFGLAVTVGSQDKAKIKLLGTQSYLAPEHAMDGKLTEKSDVYAFGIILLELLMGEKLVEHMASSQCESVVKWAMPHITDRVKLLDIIDPVIRGTMDLKHLYQVAAVAVLCIQPEPSYRPLVTDVLHSLIPLVPIELGGTFRVSEHAARNSDVEH